ncbi:hypothetical protein glysoja_002025 [Glycine soja]|nr:hypothetical protein glysoja_002025 [Glycine soja]
MENNPKEQAEQQRVNFNGDPHIHDNGNVFHHFQPTPAVDSDQVDVSCKVYVAPVPRTATEDESNCGHHRNSNMVAAIAVADCNFEP